MATDKDFQKEVVTRLISLSDSVGGLDKKVELHIQSTQYELQGIRALDEQQNKLIDQHIEGVKNLRIWLDRHEVADQDRFGKLEAPSKWWKQTTVYVLKVGAIVGVFAGAAELWYYLAHMN